MNPVDAFAFLGLDSNAEPDQIRRAYLRLLKKFHPERDSAGFQKLRSAYEVARAATGEGAPAGFEAPPAHGDELREDGHPLDAQARERFALQPFLAKLESLSDDAADVWAAREEIARQAVEALPGNAEAVLFLASILRSAGSTDDAVALLRAGAQRGLEACTVDLFLWHADALSEEEQTWPSTQPVQLVLELAIQLLASGQGSRATPLVETALARADEAEPAAFVWAQMRICLLLQCQDQIDLARRLVPEIEQRMDVRAWSDDGMEIRVLWMLTRELTSLPDAFPERLRRAIAVGIYSDRLSDVSDAMHEFAMEAPSAAHAASRLMKAPTLDHLYGHLLSGPSSGDDSDPLSLAKLIFGILWLLLVVSGPFIYNHFFGFTSVLLPTDARFPMQDPAEDPVQQICASSTGATSEACDLVHDGFIRLGTYRCSHALEALAALEKIEGVSPPDLEMLVVILRGVWVEHCKAQAVANHWPSYQASPSLVATCSLIDAGLDGTMLGFCYRSRAILSATGSADCIRAHEGFAELKRRFSNAAEKKLRVGLEEVWSQVNNKCGDADS